MARNDFKNPGRSLEIGANVGTAFASRRPITALSLIPQAIIFYHTGKGLNLRKFGKFMLLKWNKEHQS